MADTPGTSGAESGVKRDVVGEFKRQPMAEKILAVAAAAFLLAFIFDGTGWSILFKSWKATLAFFGCIGVLVLVVTSLLGIRLVAPKLYNWLLVIAAVLPALGLALDALRNFWYFVMLASILLMAYAGAKITTREQILR
jgi:hypothetical protein